MSESEPETGSIRDEDLPEDLQPGEENPLAEPLDEDDVDRDGLDVQGGKTPEESEDDEHTDNDEEDDDGASDNDG